MSNYRTSTRIRAQASVLSIESITRTSMSCEDDRFCKHGECDTNYFHRSGSVCLDVINQTWSPMYDMINIFEVFLPQLLRYPNPSDPLNGEAAAMLMREPKSYEAKVRGTSLRWRTHWAGPKLIDPLQNTSPNTPPKKPSTTPARIQNLKMS